MRANARIPHFWLVIMLYWGAIYAYVPLLTPYAQDLGASLQMIGLITGSYGLMQLILRVPLGMLSDHLGRRRLFITAGAVFCTGSAVMMLLARSPGWILAARCMAGVAASAYVPMAVLYARCVPQDRVSRSASAITAVSSCGQLVAMTAGGWLAGQGGNALAFWLGIGLGVLAFISSFFLPDPPVDTMPLRLQDGAAVLRTPGLLAASLLAALSQSLYFGKALGFAPLAAKALSATTGQLGFVTTLASLCGFAASMLAAYRLLAWLGEKRLVAIGFGLYLISCVMMPFAGSVGWVLVSQGLTGLGQGLVIPMLMGLAVQHVADHRKATAMGFYQAIYALGMFLGPWIVGIIGDWFTLTAGFWFCTALSAGGLTWSLLWLGQERRDRMAQV